ncbi:MAG: sigma-54-dependent Fis family transcriptional regulator [Acidobacteria bacterium]|nr:MAG: sigma-54-dependent Fis family transcriptional regulator [Acidobacteriota bacterium]
MTLAPQTITTEFRRELNQLPAEAIVFGHSEYMRAVRNRIERVAALEMPVLIEGESGTGKDIIAKMLHERAPWMSGLFVKVRCSSIPDTFEDLVEYSDGAVNGLSQSTPEGSPCNCYGTLFLDEISEATATLQLKLLRLLQEGQFCSINLKRFKLNFRVICATNCGLEHAAAQGNFRRDLLYRINAITIRVPSLRERIVDVPDLVDHFLNLFSSAYNCESKRLSPRMLQSLLRYSWPGNIRELENLIRRYVLFGCEETVCDELLGRAATKRNAQKNAQELSAPGAVSLKELTRKAAREVEREAILKVLEANQWNRKRAACVLNISYRALLYKLKDTGMVPAPSSSNRMEARRGVNTAAI